MNSNQSGRQQDEPLLPTLVAFAHELADLARPVTLKYFRQRIEISDKGPVAGVAFDPVTAADRDAELVIRARIAQRFPDHGVLGEEHGAANAASPMQWIVDPVDGTRAFIMGWPMWGTLIGLVGDGRPLLGLMDQPFTRERFFGTRDEAFAILPDGECKRLACRPCAGLGEAVLSSTHPDLFAPGMEADGFSRVKDAARMTRFGGDCYAYAMLAAGFSDLVVEAQLKAYDIAPLIPIIEGAGGIVTTWDGGPAAGGGNIVAAGDARVHAEAVALLAAR